MNEIKEIELKDKGIDNRIDIFNPAIMDSLNAFAETIANSKLYPHVTSAADVVTAIIIGNEIGLTPMVSIANAKKLTTNTIQSVLRGKEMGLKAAFALDNIHQIPTKNGAVTATGVHVFTAMLIKAGVVHTIIEDATPLYKYIEISTKQILDKELVEDNPMSYQIVNVNTKKEDRDLSKSQVILNTVPYTYRTVIRFERELINQTITISYSLQDATDAGLYPGISSVTGLPIDGKQNWIENWKTMLRNRVLSLGSRIIIADLVGGVYEYSEIADSSFITDVGAKQVTILMDKDGKEVSRTEKDNTDSDNNVTY